jgi:hypothetical protein
MLTHSNLYHIYGEENVTRTVLIGYYVLVYTEVFEVLIVVLMKIQVFWDVKLDQNACKCHLILHGG